MKVSAVETIAVAACALMLGGWLRRVVPLLSRLNIPASIVGGLVFALANWMARIEGVQVDFDTALRDPLMLTCFSIIGFNASLRVLWRGGRLIAILMGIASAGALLQNVAGMGLAKLAGLNPLIGTLAGSVSLAGGPATSQAFGATFEALGVQGATTIALASATFGIAVSGLIAGGLGGWLIRRGGLASGRESESNTSSEFSIDGTLLSTHALWIAVALGAGAVMSRSIAAAGVVVPGYIGAMCVAAALRNADDRWGFARFDERVMAAVFQALLPVFIATSMVTLKIWELQKLAIPLLLILIVQTVITVVFCAASFRVLGGDYEAAVATTGLCGFMLGITPNAMASMQEIADRHGPAPKAFLAIPVAGGFLLDFANSLLITATVSAVQLIH